MPRKLYTCPWCGDTLSYPPASYSTCPARPKRAAPAQAAATAPAEAKPKPSGRAPRISAADIVRVRSGDLSTCSLSVSAAALGCTPSYISMIRNGHVRKTVQ